ncbi:hypothetical protein [Natronohydrobacter thiooxidans]|uniref:hypothetical protein n=1 Tax=Natronohydrobacter thiooxidans TaxID=87172 RepID=UPI000A5DA50D|nr:hypothetical protein [Natronohydrobacter thiooxidans]
MPEHVDSVNRVAAFFREQANTSSAQWREKFTTFAAQLEGASQELVKLYGLTSALPPDLGNIHDLPPDLLEELAITKGDELDDQLVTVINAYGGEASLDQILVGLYRKFQVKQKRRFLQNKLYRMTTVWSVEGRKGIYTTTQPQAGLLTPVSSEHSQAGLSEVKVQAVEEETDIPF